MSGSAHLCLDGLRIARDAYPVIDELDTPRGLIVTGGIYGGVSLSSAYAVAVKSLVMGDDCPFSLEPFRADRFEDTSLDFDWVKEWPV